LSYITHDRGLTNKSPFDLNRKSCRGLHKDKLKLNEMFLCQVDVFEVQLNITNLYLLQTYPTNSFVASFFLTQAEFNFYIG
jgi:hypothetical protein